MKYHARYNIIHPVICILATIKISILITGNQGTVVCIIFASLEQMSRIIEAAGSFILTVKVSVLHLYYMRFIFGCCYIVLSNQLQSRVINLVSP